MLWIMKTCVSLTLLIYALFFAAAPSPPCHALKRTVAVPLRGDGVTAASTVLWKLGRDWLRHPHSRNGRVGDEG